eukprot:768206-Hanusia_phi.AAC.3
MLLDDAQVFSSLSSKLFLLTTLKVILTTLSSAGLDCFSRLQNKIDTGLRAFFLALLCLVLLCEWLQKHLPSCLLSSALHWVNLTCPALLVCSCPSHHRRGMSVRGGRRSHPAPARSSVGRLNASDPLPPRASVTPLWQPLHPRRRSPSAPCHGHLSILNSRHVPPLAAAAASLSAPAPPPAPPPALALAPAICAAASEVS